MNLRTRRKLAKRAVGKLDQGVEPTYKETMALSDYAIRSIVRGTKMMKQGLEGLKEQSR